MPDRPSLDALREAARSFDSGGGTHYAECYKYHERCAIWHYAAALEAEVERLRAREAKVRERCAKSKPTWDGMPNVARAEPSRRSFGPPSARSGRVAMGERS